MNTRFLAALFSLAFSTLLLGSEKLSDADAAAVIAGAKTLQKAFVDGDADTIIRATHPVILKIAGTRKQFEKITRDALKSMKGMFTFEKTDWGEPTACEVGDTDEVCFIPRTDILKMGDKRIRSVAFLIAARAKGTKQWLYLDGASVSKNPEQMHKMFPGLPKDLKLPPNSLEILN